MQSLKIGIAKHKPIVSVPQDECFRNSLNRITQAHICGDGFFYQALLLSYVNRDPDEMQAGVVGLANKFAAGAQPYPVAVRMTHAECMIDRGRGCVRKFDGEVVETDVLGMHEGIHVAE